MEEKDYSKRELDMKFKNSEEKNDAWFATVMAAIEDMRKHELQPILKQTTITNGRVGRLEERQGKVENLIMWLKGGAYFFVPAFVSVSGWLIYEHIQTQRTIDERVQQTVQAELSNFQIVEQ